MDGIHYLDQYLKLLFDKSTTMRVSFSDIVVVPAAERSDKVPDVMESQPHPPQVSDYIMEGNTKSPLFIRCLFGKRVLLCYTISLSVCSGFPHFLPLSPSGWRGIVVTVRAGGRAGGCQTCGTHISVTAWRIFSIRSSMELSRPVVVHCHGNLPICPIWACPWAKNLSNLPQIGSRLCGTHISKTAGWIYPI